MHPRDVGHLKARRPHACCRSPLLALPPCAAAAPEGAIAHASVLALPPVRGGAGCAVEARNIVPAGMRRGRQRGRAQMRALPASFHSQLPAAHPDCGSLLPRHSSQPHRAERRNGHRRRLAVDAAGNPVRPGAAGIPRGWARRAAGTPPAPTAAAATAAARVACRSLPWPNTSLASSDAACWSH